MALGDRYQPTLISGTLDQSTVAALGASPSAEPAAPSELAAP
jgi:hypothetical protein